MAPWIRVSYCLQLTYFLWYFCSSCYIMIIQDKAKQTWHWKYKACFGKSLFMLFSFNINFLIVWTLVDMLFPRERSYKSGTRGARWRTILKRSFTVKRISFPFEDLCFPRFFFCSTLCESFAWLNLCIWIKKQPAKLFSCKIQVPLYFHNAKERPL